MFRKSVKSLYISIPRFQGFRPTKKIEKIGKEKFEKIGKKTRFFFFFFFNFRPIKNLDQQSATLRTMPKQDCSGRKRKQNRLCCHSIFDWAWLEPWSDQMSGSRKSPKNLAIETKNGRWWTLQSSWNSKSLPRQIF